MQQQEEQICIQKSTISIGKAHFEIGAWVDCFG